MRVQIAARHCDVPDHVKERAEAQLRKLEKYEPGLSAAEVVFKEEKHVKSVEGILSIDRVEPVVAEGDGDDFTRAVDKLVERLGRILRKGRSRRMDRRTRGSRSESASGG